MFTLYLIFLDVASCVYMGYIMFTLIDQVNIMKPNRELDITSVSEGLCWVVAFAAGIGLVSVLVMA